MYLQHIGLINKLFILSQEAYGPLGYGVSFSMD